MDGEGEILVRGRTLCLGYLCDGVIEPCCDEEGWFHTGDSGWFDSDGYLTVTGRRDRMFISGGENIYPEEIEAALVDLPEIDEAAVVALPDATYGARPVAFVRITSGTTVNDEAVRTALAAALPTFKVPDRILPWPTDYPPGSMKVDREFLRRRAQELHATSV